MTDLLKPKMAGLLSLVDSTPQLSHKNTIGRENGLPYTEMKLPLNYLTFSTKNNRNPAHPFFDKKVKGIVYSDKSTVCFFPPDLKSRSPDQVQPCR